jgi:hypothetical protein
MRDSLPVEPAPFAVSRQCCLAAERQLPVRGGGKGEGPASQQALRPMKTLICEGGLSGVSPRSQSHMRHVRGVRSLKHRHAGSRLATGALACCMAPGNNSRRFVDV